MTQITISGNTVAAADVRFTPAGKAVASFTVAVNERRFDKQTNEWVDGDTTFYPCSAWGQMGENCAETLVDKGMRVLVVGRIKSRKFTNREGVDVTRFEVEVDEVGPSLRYATAVVTRAGVTTTVVPTGGGKPAPRQPAGRPPAADPWAGITQQTEAPF